MVPLALIKLTTLMERTSGNPEVKIGLIDGPVLTKHPDLASERPLEIPRPNSVACTQAKSVACLHGTFVAGILSAKRGSPAPAICPDCTLVVRPIFPEATSGSESMPSAAPRELAAAIGDCVDACARIINLSLALAHPSTKGEQELEDALDRAFKRSVIVVAAGNQGMLGSSAITRHLWVIPVVVCDRMGRPISESNFGSSIGRRGLAAPWCGHHQLGDGRSSSHIGRHEYGGPLRDRCDCAVMVGISCCNCRATQARYYPSNCHSESFDRSALAGCGCSLPIPLDIECQERDLMKKAIKTKDISDQHTRSPHHVRLPGFITDEEIGLGDVVKRATTYLGIRPCGGCEQRATALNRWLVFTKRAK